MMESKIKSDGVLKPLIEIGIRIAKNGVDCLDNDSLSVLDSIDWDTVRSVLEHQKEPLFGMIENFDHQFSFLADDSELRSLAAEIFDLRISAWYVQLASLASSGGWVDMDDWDQEMMARADILYSYLPDEVTKAENNIVTDLPWFLNQEIWEDIADSWEPIEIDVFRNFADHDSLGVGPSSATMNVTTSEGFSDLPSNRMSPRIIPLEPLSAMAASKETMPVASPAIWLASPDEIHTAALTLSPTGTSNRFSVLVCFFNTPSSSHMERYQGACKGDSISLTLYWTNGESSVASGLVDESPESGMISFSEVIDVQHSNGGTHGLVSNKTELKINNKYEWSVVTAKLDPEAEVFESQFSDGSGTLYSEIAAAPDENSDIRVDQSQDDGNSENPSERTPRALQSILEELLTAEPSYSIAAFDLRIVEDSISIEPVEGLTSLALGDGEEKINKFRIRGLTSSETAAWNGKELSIIFSNRSAHDEGRLFIESPTGEILTPSFSDDKEIRFELDARHEGSLRITSESKVVSAIEKAIRSNAGSAADRVSILRIISAKWGLQCAILAANSKHVSIREAGLQILIEYGSQLPSLSNKSHAREKLIEIGRRPALSLKEETLLQQFRSAWGIAGE